MLKEKIIGIQDTEGKNIGIRTVYYKKIRWDIQRERSSQDFLKLLVGTSDLRFLA